MIPAAFDYHRAVSVDDAVERLASFGEDARVLAGGQSLIPLMRLRFSAPSALVDVSALRDLAYVRLDEDRLRVGATTRHQELQENPVVREHLPLLSDAAAQIGDTQIRNAGTLGGAVAHADPAGEYPALCLMLDADIVTTRRVIAARDFFLGRYTTPLSHDEMLIEVAFPVASGGHSYLKFGHHLFDWALAGVAVQIDDLGCRIGLVNVADTPIRARAAEEAVAQGAAPRDAAELAAESLDPIPSPRASSEYKRQLVRVLTERALTAARADR